MRDAAGHWRGVRIAGYDVVRIMLGLILLTAAALKGHQLATEPVVETSLLTSRWFLIGVVEFELFFGLWLLSGLCPRRTWQAALLCFSAFACVSLYKALSGESSCGCFGRVPVNPWYTLILDLAATAALLLCRPTQAQSPGGHAFSRRGAARVVAISLIVGIPAALAMGSYHAATIDEAGDIFGDSDFVVLEPEKWVGKRFPLLEYIDIGDRLAEGEWIVVLYHHDCPKCQETLLKYDQMASDKPGTPIALIAMPPYDRLPQKVLSSAPSCLLGRLRAEREWFGETPVIILLDQGMISAVRVGVGESEVGITSRPSSGFSQST